MMNEPTSSAYSSHLPGQEAKISLLQLPRARATKREHTTGITKNTSGNLKLHPSIALLVAGLVSGGFWGLLIGLIFRNPLLALTVGVVVGLFTVVPVSVLIIRAVDEDVEDEPARTF
jgi:uncharacterized membrane protein